MKHLFSTFTLCIAIAISLAGCDKGPALSGYLWFGQNSGIAMYDLASRRASFPEGLEGCDEAAATPLEDAFTFVCTTKQGRSLVDFTILESKYQATSAVGLPSLSDPALSPDGSRTLFRTLISGDVYEGRLLFQNGGTALLAKGIGAACFGLNNQSLYLAQGNKLAAHIVEDITQPEKMPENGLSPLLKGPGTIRDITFHLGLKRIAYCSGTQVLTCDITGQKQTVLYDAVEGLLPGILQLPYRVRFNREGTKLAIIASGDGVKGTFLFADLNGGKPWVLNGAKPKVGGFAWTKERPVHLR